MGFSNWFGAVTKKAPSGKSSFSLYKKHSKASYKRAIKPLSASDRTKAKALETKLRNKSGGSLSQRQLLTAAYKEYGAVFRDRLKTHAFTTYKKDNPLFAERQHRRNIFEIQRKRAEEQRTGKSIADKKHFIGQVNAKDVTATASRLGAKAGKSAPRPQGKDIGRSIWRKG